MHSRQIGSVVPPYQLKIVMLWFLVQDWLTHKNELPMPIKILYQINHNKVIILTVLMKARTMHRAQRHPLSSFIYIKGKSLILVKMI